MAEALQQQRRRRPRSGRVLAAAVALAALAAGLPLATSFLGAGGSEAGRRAVLAGAAGALVASAGATEAQAQLQPSLPAPKKKKKKEMTEEELTTLVRSRMGSNLGKLVNIKDQCLYYGDVPDDPGWTANIGTDGVIAWDQDEPCPDGQVYIIGSARGELLRMSAAKGPTKHKFVAGTFEYPVVMDFKKNIGKCVKQPEDGEDFISWEIANMPRGGKCS